MDEILCCNKNKRILAFFIDRVILFTLWYIFLKYNGFSYFLDEFKHYISIQDIANSLKLAVLIPVIAYGYLLIIYFFYFVIIHLIINNTIGKFIFNIQLIVMKDKIQKKVNFFDLLKRYFFLYISGIGGFGYFYILHSNKKSNYDDIIGMYVINKK